MLSILFVFILVRSPEPYVGAIARLRDFAVSLWSECSAHDERQKKWRAKVPTILWRSLRKCAHPFAQKKVSARISCSDRL
jgi:hypothetical protein